MYIYIYMYIYRRTPAAVGARTRPVERTGRLRCVYIMCMYMYMCMDGYVVYI